MVPSLPVQSVRALKSVERRRRDASSNESVSGSAAERERGANGAEAASTGDTVAPVGAAAEI